MLAEGRSLGARFTLIRPLGRGGMSEAWLVHDRDLDEQVVAKIVPEGAPDERIALLRREFRNVRRLTHPHIAPVYEFHQVEGISFITMAFVAGGDLTQYRGRPPAEVAALVLPLADALQYAHERGIVHRDLKLANVRCDDEGRPLLIDFGIAGTLLPPEDGLTLRGGGSPHSASPQQRAGEPPCPSDDIYAFGVLLYELIAGHPPYREALPDAAALAAPPPLRSSHAVPPRLQSLVERMLSREAVQRPSGMGEIGAELREILDDLRRDAAGLQNGPAPARHVAPPPRVRPISPIAPRAAADASGHERRSRVARWATIGTIGFLILVLLAVFLFLPRWSERIARQAAEAAAVAAVPAPDPTDAGPPASASDAGGAQAPAVESPSVDEEHRETALDLLQRATELSEQLGARAAGQWGGGDWDQGVTALAEGEEQLTDGHWAAAESSFGRAVELFQLLEARSRDVLAQALADGREALAAGDASGARDAFGLAVSIDPGNGEAATGLRRAAVVHDVLAQLDAGARSERRGELAAAERSYAGALNLDSHSNDAREALARVRARMQDDAFARVMSEGLSALGRADYGAAREAFARAAQLRPGSAQVADGLAQLDEAERLQSIGAFHAEAVELEAAERWRAASKLYDAVLGMDSVIRFAQEGRARCVARAELAEEMAYHLTHPERLSTDEVFAEAAALFAEAQEVQPAGALHQHQLRELGVLLERAGTPVDVTLESDEQTEVTVYRVGRLGTFLRQQLQLRPGTYTVVGSRRGYRDVRRTLVVVAGQLPEPLSVRCEEKI